MKIKIKSDPNNYIDQMFNDSLKTYNYIKTDILLYLLYGEGIRWSYFEDEDTFYIKQNNTYLTELSRSEWRELFTENCISINKNRSAISIKAREDIEKKFLKLLDELDFKYTINATTKLNNILSGE